MSGCTSGYPVELSRTWRRASLGVSTQLLNGELSAFYIDAASASAGARISELPFPPESAAMLIVRGLELLAPKGDTVLQPGDHVYVFSRTEDLPFLRLMFGQREDE